MQVTDQLPSKKWGPEFDPQYCQKKVGGCLYIKYMYFTESLTPGPASPLCSGTVRIFPAPDNTTITIHPELASLLHRGPSRADLRLGGPSSLCYNLSPLLSEHNGSLDVMLTATQNGCAPI
jgi:hypothetical protein